MIPPLLVKTLKSGLMLPNIPLPHKLFVGVSGGPDSMAILHILKELGHDVTGLFFHHGTEFSEKSRHFLSKTVQDIPLEYGKIQSTRNKGRSPECFWRECRLDYFASVCGSHPVVVGTHLGDVSESVLIHIRRGHDPEFMAPSILWEDDKRGGLTIVRPFILYKKQQLINFCDRRSIPYLIDPSNLDGSNLRSQIRRDIIPFFIPGCYAFARKQVVKRWNAEQDSALEERNVS